MRRTVGSDHPVRCSGPDELLFRSGQTPAAHLKSCMMTIMRHSKHNARAAAKEASHERIEQTEAGRPLAALGAETVRQAPEVRRARTRHIKAMVDLVARQSPDWGQPAAHERALLTIAAMVGTLLLARAVDEPALSDSLCEA